MALSIFVASPAASYLTRAGSDFLLPLAAALHEQNNSDAATVALVVIDEVTHNTPPFSITPEVAWTPYIGGVMRAINDAGPAVIGLDMIFPKSIAGRNLAPGHDRLFLQALAEIGRPGKLVLAEVRLSDTPIRPYAGQEIAVGGGQNIRPVHLTPDADNIVRRHPAFLPLEDGGRVRSFAAELSARAGAVPEESILIDYVSPAARFATYRFSDLYECLQSGNMDGFSAFKDKVVLIGTALDIEDRHIAGNRLQENKTPPILPSPCVIGDAPSGKEIYRASTAGIFIEARAVDTFMTGAAPKVMSGWLVLLATLTLTLTLAVGFLRAGPAAGFGMLAVAAVALWLAGAQLFAIGVIAPVLPWVIAASVLFICIYSYRVIVEGQSKRWITHAFQYYLNPALVDQLAEHPDSLKLGGERRRAAVLFADLEGFTTTSEQMVDQPEALVAHLNNFFQIMTSNIESHDGYVDKFIGDAVMGVWGAPVAMENPERASATAALACIAAVDEWNARQEAQKGLTISMRIGISAGDVIAGNLGSKDRFNYTVIGDAVNRASRLEQENKRLLTKILIDEEIASYLPPDFHATFIEETPLRGQNIATRIYTLKTAV